MDYNMDLRHLKRLMDIFDESSATELSVEEEGIKLKISKHKKDFVRDGNPNNMPMIQMQPNVLPMQAQPELTNVQAPTPITEASSAVDSSSEEDKFHVIQSPIVGTFYRSPSPDSDPFVEIGTHVTAGTTLCIIEAMKLMNEIESDISGTVEKILIDNAKPVEYNEALFYIKPD